MIRKILYNFRFQTFDLLLNVGQLFGTNYHFFPICCLLGLKIMGIPTLILIFLLRSSISIVFYLKQIHVYYFKNLFEIFVLKCCTYYINYYIFIIPWYMVPWYHGTIDYNIDIDIDYNIDIDI